MNSVSYNSDSSQIDSAIPSLEIILNYALTELQIKKDMGGLTGIPSGFIALDRITAGWQRPQLIILASRPAMGKTSFILSALRNAAVDHGEPVAIFSLEMTSVQLVNRLISAEAEIDAEKIKKGALAPHEWTQLSHKVQRLTDAPIFIDDTTDLNIEQLREKCLRLIEEHGVKLIAIDYLQLMLPINIKGSYSEYEELSKLTRGLKKLSKELNISIIALSQLSRSVETRIGDKKPSLSDLRGSGTIEDDSDMVMFLYRPEYYNITADENGNSTAGLGEVIIAKNRYGTLDTIQLRFINKFTKFCDLDSYFTPEVNGLSSFDSPQPSAGSVFKSKAKIISNFGNADPSQETPF
ncbi:replicative DNA helicase [Spirosoma fluviale]|uniref:Replicative DNA helicase n=1 Tax=Spirosoma fluviale TaxID=1597977 RepID=A0A286FGM7_9BACT|nr:replicative DNA helicase [Spirosoma fluviale]